VGGFVIEQMVTSLATRDAYFWGTHNGAELDLMVMTRGKRHGFECKYADAPGTTKSMHVALEDLGLAHLWVIYPGTETLCSRQAHYRRAAREIPALAEELKTSHA